MISRTRKGLWLILITQKWPKLTRNLSGTKLWLRVTSQQMMLFIYLFWILFANASDLASYYTASIDIRGGEPPHSCTYKSGLARSCMSSCTWDIHILMTKFDSESLVLILEIVHLKKRSKRCANFSWLLWIFANSGEQGHGFLRERRSPWSFPIILLTPFRVFFTMLSTTWSRFTGLLLTLLWLANLGMRNFLTLVPTYNYECWLIVFLPAV